MRLHKSKYAHLYPEWLEKYSEGRTVLSIAKEYGVKDSTISKYLKMQLNLNKLKRKKKYEAFYEEWVNLYLQGESPKKISKTYLVSESTVIRSIFPFIEKRRSDFYRKKYRKYAIDDTYFQYIDTPNKAYILGFLLADGTQNVKCQQIILALQHRDRHILEDIKKVIGYDKPLNFRKCNKKCQDQYVLLICNARITADLDRHGIVHNKTYNIKYPENSVSDDLFIHLFRGLVDGDGFFSSTKDNKNPCIGLTGERKFISIIQDKLRRLYNIDSFTKDEKNPNFITMRIRRQSDIKHLYELFYTNTELFLKRKRDSIHNFLTFKKLI